MLPLLLLGHGHFSVNYEVLHLPLELDGGNHLYVTSRSSHSQLGQQVV